MTMTIEPRTRQQRRDALPENVVYRDNGCRVHPSCLTCPLETCIHDLKGGGARYDTNQRQDEIRRLLNSGLRTLEVKARMGLSKRTIQRVAALMRAEGL